MSKSLSLKHCIWLCGTVHWVGSVYQTTHLIVKLFKWTFVLKLLIFKKCQRKIRDQTIHLIFCYPTQNKKFNHVSCLKIRSMEKSLENAYQNLKTWVLSIRIMIYNSNKRSWLFVISKYVNDESIFS